MKKKQITVIGGGIVGVCSALRLQQDGHQVTLLDRKPPGRETSYGNAGVLSESSILVLNNPSLLKSLPKLLLHLTQGFRYSPLFLMKKLTWALRFLSYCTNAHMQRAARALKSLQDASLSQHKSWIKEAKAEHLLAEKGWLKVFRTQEAFDGYQSELALFRAHGVKYTVLMPSELKMLEPGLEPIYVKAVLLDNTCRVTNPAALTDAYITLFQAAGGTVKIAEVMGLRPSEHTWRLELNEDESINADEVILAAGPWSADIAGWLGYDIPMAWERGFHLHFTPDTVPSLGRAIHDVSGGFVMAPMQKGIRISTGVELADRDAPANRKQVNAAVALARTAYRMKAAVESTPWIGSRPTLADSLPMIGPAPNHPGLWFNFGHQHIGLSTGPASGDIISAMISGREAPLDAKPFCPTRF